MENTGKFEKTDLQLDFENTDELDNNNEIGI